MIWIFLSVFGWNFLAVLMSVLDQNVEICTDDNDQPHPDDCRLYYSCTNRTKIETRCDKDLHFDLISSTCTASRTALCANANNNPCTSQLNGFHPLLLNCQNFVKCENNRVVKSYQCPKGFVFDPVSRSCVTKGACLEVICKKSTGVFWIPFTNCQSYYFCRSGIPVEHRCPYGHTFSIESKECVKNGECYEPLCVGKKDGFHADSAHHCRRILYCQGGVVKKIGHCEDGKAFNGTHCVDESFFRCENPFTTAISVDLTGDDCLGYSDGPHLVVGSDCRRYQICKNRRILLKAECPKNQHFDGVHCVPNPPNFSCPNPCENLPNGYHPDHSQSCRKYNLCYHQELAKRFSCSEGTLYSGTMCLPASLVPCNIALHRNPNPCLGLMDGLHADYQNKCETCFFCQNNTVRETSPCGAIKCGAAVLDDNCHGKVTGLYVNLTSDCESYYYCHQNRKTNLQCPFAKLFNGTSCVDKYSFRCPSRDVNSCIHKPNGYYPLSDCRSYFLCLGGRKIVYRCPKDFIFNGTQCVYGDMC